MEIKSVIVKGTVFSAKEIFCDELAKIVFLGRANVGKSSLINGLLQRRHLARISSTPGKTVSINYYLVDGEFYFVDMPGYGYSRVAQGERGRIEKLMTAFFDRSRRVVLAMLLLDSRRGLQAADMEVWDFLAARNFPLLTILTKSDKITRSEIQNLTKKIHLDLGVPAIPISTKFSTGKEKIWQHIKEAMKERSCIH